MKTFLSILLACFSVSAANYNTYDITFTNTPANGDKITVDGTARIFTNAPLNNVTWLTTGSSNTVATNFNISMGRNSSYAYTRLTSSNIVHSEGSGLVIFLTGSFGYITTNSAVQTNGWTPVLPFSRMYPTNQTNTAEEFVYAIGYYTRTSSIPEGAQAFTNYVSLTNAQRLSNKTFTSPVVSGGSISNVALTNVTANNLSMSGTLSVGPSTTTHVQSRVKFDANSLVFTNTDTGESYNMSLDTGVYSKPAHYSELVTLSDYVDAVDLYKTDGTNMTVGGTNNWNADVAYSTHAYTSLVNGDNSNIEIGTNVVALLSGATGTANIHSFGVKRTGIDVLVRLSGGTNYVIYNESGTEGTATRRITTCTGGNFTMTNNPSYMRVRYTGTRWEVITRSN